MYRFTKLPEELRTENLGGFAFVPLMLWLGRGKFMAVDSKHRKIPSALHCWSVGQIGVSEFLVIRSPGPTARRRGRAHRHS